MQVTGIGTATITPQGTIDSNFRNIQAWSYTSQSWVSTITADGLFWVPLVGLDQFQANITSYTSGTITVTVKGEMQAPGPAPAPAPQTSGVIGTVGQGAGAALGAPWPVKLSDGTNAQLPAAAALADALANPTTTDLEALNGLFNGTTWDRQRGNQDNVS